MEQTRKFGGIKKKKKERKERRRKRRRERAKERERERERKKGKRGFRFSLRSTEIGPSIFIGARDKVHLRKESFA